MQSTSEVNAEGSGDRGVDESRAVLEALKERVAELNERAKGLIKERPLACLVGAVALGYVVARIARRRS